MTWLDGLYFHDFHVHGPLFQPLHVGVNVQLLIQLLLLILEADILVQANNFIVPAVADALPGDAAHAVVEVEVTDAGTLQD